VHRADKLQPKSARPSIVPPTSTISTRRSSLLGELRNAGNTQTPPPTTAPSKGKARINETIKAVTSIEEKQKKTVHVQPEPTITRVVSAPSLAKRTRQLTDRSTSGPPAPSSSALLLSCSSPTPVPIIEEEDEEEEEEEERSPSRSRIREQTEDGLDLAWALRPSSRGSQLPPEHATECTMEEMRREIANLQLDILRMGRNLKVSA